MEARNELESYAYSLKNQIGDKEKLGGKLDDSDKKTIETALDDAISWLESHRVSFYFILFYILYLRTNFMWNIFR